MSDSDNGTAALRKKRNTGIVDYRRVPNRDCNWICGCLRLDSNAVMRNRTFTDGDINRHKSRFCTETNPDRIVHNYDMVKDAACTERSVKRLIKYTVATIV